jgi:hypothetical protein
VSHFAHTFAAWLTGFLPGLLIGAWYTIYLRRPKLRIVGGGGGGDQRFRASHINITNEPGRLGMKLGPTILFGRELHGWREFGVSFDRNRAPECRAALFDRKTSQHLAPLWWHSTEPGAPWQQAITLESGAQAELWVFARLTADPTKCFVFEPSDPASPSTEPRVPSDAALIETSREFTIRVSYFGGRHRVKFPAAVTKEFNGTLHSSYGRKHTRQGGML